MTNHKFMMHCTYWLACLGIFVAFQAAAGGRGNTILVDGPSKQSAEDDAAANEGLQQTLNLNFSPENREKIRQALDAYARSVDENHQLIEESRRAMQDSIEKRFLDADGDGDGSVSRQEATEKLPQVARHFNKVDSNQDENITIDELEAFQEYMLERRKAAETEIEAKKLQAAINAIAAKPKETKQTAVNAKKRTF